MEGIIENAMFGNIPGIVFSSVIFAALFLKFAVCMFGHPFLIARNYYYPHPEAFNLSYVWIVFYYIEVMVTIPNAMILAYEMYAKNIQEMAHK